MSGETLIRLSRGMAAKPSAGLIQTVPKLTGGTTLLQRLQQFASQVYGPIVAAGLALWHRDEGNYWGHNAIIRTEAFATAAGFCRSCRAGRRSAGTSRATISSRRCCCSVPATAYIWRRRSTAPTKACRRR